MRGGSGILGRSEFSNGLVIRGEEHAQAYTITEFLDLVPDIVKERIAEPTANEHDGIHTDAGKIHGHGGRWLDGMDANIRGGVTENVLVNGFNNSLDSREELGGLDVKYFGANAISVDGSSLIGFGIAENTGDGGWPQLNEA